MCVFLHVVTAQTIYDCVWNVVDKSTTEDKQFIDAVSLIFESLLRLAVELPLYKLYNNKLSRDIIAAYKVTASYLKLLLTLSAHAQDCYSSRFVCLSVCQHLILKMTAFSRLKWAST